MRWHDAKALQPRIGLVVHVLLGDGTEQLAWLSSKDPEVWLPAGGSARITLPVVKWRYRP